jgi:hypothetical protein
MELLIREVLPFGKFFAHFNITNPNKLVVISGGILLRGIRFHQTLIRVILLAYELVIHGGITIHPVDSSSMSWKFRQNNHSSHFFCELLHSP